jgi:hypothetical protein
MLLYAANRQAVEHERTADWLEGQLNDTDFARFTEIRWRNPLAAQSAA